MSYDNITIATAMRQIRNGDLVLPAIQRDFVWSPERIYRFLDSLMRGYPIGTLLFWNTKQRVQYRQFIKDKTAESRYDFAIKEEGKRGTMVLDGQQRLQSLYLALEGTRNREQLYFDILSGVDPEDTSEAKYHFEFMAAAKAVEQNGQNQGHHLWIPLSSIYQCRNIAERASLTERYLAQAGIDRLSDGGSRLALNVEIAYSKLKAEEVLSHYSIDPDYGEDLKATPIDEILEIFVRINSGGQVLSKSDLMFSLMQLYWEGAAESIEALLDELETHDLSFDKDFVLRCALVCCGKGARYDVDKLRDEETIKQIQTGFPRISRALATCVQFVTRHAKILDGRILVSYNTLIPFVYFLYHQDRQELGDETMLRAMKHALYLALMTSAFARYTDSRVDGVVREVFDPARRAGTKAFPLDPFRAFIKRYEGRDRIDNWLLQRNILLLMNILEGGTVLPKGQRWYRPEVDHIFPVSKLKAAGVVESEINDFANLRLIAKLGNIWKSNTDPQLYFAANPGVAEQYLIPTELLDYSQYNQFLMVRRNKIWERLQAFLGLTDADLPVEDRLVPGQENTVIDQLEQRLRDLIHEQLQGAIGDHYWKVAMPGQTQEGVKRRLEEHLRRHPGQSAQDYATGRAQLNFCDVSDYEIIILTKDNWPLFEPIFRQRGEFERHMSAMRRFRNSVKHSRVIDPIERLNGEAAILWLRQALGLSSDLSSSNPAPTENDAEKPTPEDFHRLLTRRPVPPGQQQLFKALYDAGEDGLLYGDLAKAVGRERQELAGVLGALGNRINRTPGYGQRKLPAAPMVIIWSKSPNGEWHLRLRPEMRTALEALNPTWLKSEN